MVNRLLGFLRRGGVAEDPVCHMQVDIKNPAGGTYAHGGTTYYFCAPGCRVAFSKEPDAYLSGEKGLEM